MQLVQSNGFIDGTLYYSKCSMLIQELINKNRHCLPNIHRAYRFIMHSITYGKYSIGIVILEYENNDGYRSHCTGVESWTLA